MGEETEMKQNMKIHSIDWEYQINDTQWSMYPQSLSSLIHRQCRNQNDNDTNTPIFYQTNNGNKFKINLSNSLQYNLQNNSVAMMRKCKNSQMNKPNYLKCPECLFKVSADATICNVCNYKLQNNKNPKPEKKENEIQMISNDNKQKLKPILKNDKLFCPVCKTQNNKDFNFCVGCSFDLRKHKEIINENVPGVNSFDNDLVIDIKKDENNPFDIEPGTDSIQMIEGNAENDIQPGVEEQENNKSLLEFGANWH